MLSNKKELCIFLVTEFQISKTMQNTKCTSKIRSIHRQYYTTYFIFIACSVGLCNPLPRRDLWLQHGFNLAPKSLHNVTTADRFTGCSCRLFYATDATV